MRERSAAYISSSFRFFSWAAFSSSATRLEELREMLSEGEAGRSLCWGLADLDPVCTPSVSTLRYTSPRSDLRTCSSSLLPVSNARLTTFSMNFCLELSDSSKREGRVSLGDRGCLRPDFCSCSKVSLTKAISSLRGSFPLPKVGSSSSLRRDSCHKRSGGGTRPHTFLLRSEGEAEPRGGGVTLRFGASI